MSDLDVDNARKVGVAVPPASKDDYIEASNQLQPGFVGTIDGTDPSIGWTAQHLDGERDMAGDGEAEVKAFQDPVDSLPGQVYMPDQLPDPQMAIAAGMTPQRIPAHLITDNPDHIQGPEPSESLILELRNKLRHAVARHRTGEAYAGVGEDADPNADVVVAPKTNGTKSVTGANASPVTPATPVAAGTPATTP